MANLLNRSVRTFAGRTTAGAIGTSRSVSLDATVLHSWWTDTRM